MVRRWVSCLISWAGYPSYRHFTLSLLKNRNHNHHLYHHPPVLRRVWPYIHGICYKQWRLLPGATRSRRKVKPHTDSHYHNQQVDIAVLISKLSLMRMKARRPEPAEICHKNMRFLITDRPTDTSLDKYMEELEKHGVKVVVRVCEPTYSTDKLVNHGISVCDWEFDDGSPPPPEIVQDWFNLLKARFQEEPGSCVAVHCVAGLGRAPVLVALALMEAGIKYEDAVEMIREKRRGAINAKQLAYLEHYRAKARLRQKNGRNNGGTHHGCRIL